MRKHKIWGTLLTVLFTAALLLFPTACSSVTIAAPSGFSVSDDYTLSWFSIPDARSYTVQISPLAGGDVQERTTKRTSLALADLAEGDYEIRVRSVGGRNNDIFSEWSAPVAFQREHESGILYEYANNNTEFTVAGAGTVTGDLVIDEYFRGKPVTSVKLGAFRGNSSVESIVLGPRITSIANRAFYNCSNLRSVTMPDSVTYIGYSAFQSCPLLTEVELPANITTLDTLTFGYCSGLEKVVFNDALVSIGNQAFYGCGSLGEVTFPDSLETVGASAFGGNTCLKRVTFGTGIREIGQEAFRSTALEELVFPGLSGELTFENYCLAETNFKSVEIPEGTVKIGNGAFYGAEQLVSVAIPETVTQVCYNAFAETALYDSQLSGGDGLIYADKWLIGVTNDIWETIVHLGAAERPTSPPVLFREETFGVADRAFLRLNTEGIYVGAPGLYSIDLPKSIKYLGEYSFFGCESLYRVHALTENSLISTGNYSFANCIGLTNVRFAPGLETIEAHTFYGCELLDNSPEHPEYLTPETVTRIGQNAFFGTGLYTKASRTVVYAGNWLVGFDYTLLNEDSMDFDGDLPDNIIGVADYALGGCILLERIDLSNVRYIGRSAFSYCIELSSVTLNENLSEISPYAFFMCSKLRNVRFFENLRKIGRYAFCGAGLTDADLSNTQITSIGEYAFYRCINMGSLVFPQDTLEEIGRYAFYGCDMIVDVALPGSLRTLGERAFALCNSLVWLQFSEGLEEIGAHAFRGCDHLHSITLPDSLKKVGDYAFMNCSAVQSIELGSGLKEIGSYAFAYIENTKAVIIPESVESIGDDAFRSCGSLASVTMLSMPAHVGENAFFGNNELTFYFPFAQDSVADWSPSWNISFRPVVWNCELSEEGYVDSVICGGISNAYAYLGISAPVRVGYTFAGWASERDGVPEYGPNELKFAPEGMRLYAVWRVDTQ